MDLPKLRALIDARRRIKLLGAKKIYIDSRKLRTLANEDVVNAYKEMIKVGYKNDTAVRKLIKIGYAESDLYKYGISIQHKFIPAKALDVGKIYALKRAHWTDEMIIEEFSPSFSREEVLKGIRKVEKGYVPNHFDGGDKVEEGNDIFKCVGTL